jgi:hypothetical protein
MRAEGSRCGVERSPGRYASGGFRRFTLCEEWDDRADPHMGAERTGTATGGQVVNISLSRKLDRHLSQRNRSAN